MSVDIIPIPVLKDNYVWVIKNQLSQAIIIDPGESVPVLRFLQEANLTLLAILITHHHWDHMAGIGGIIEHYDVPVYAPLIEDIDHKNHSVKDKDQLKIDTFIFDVIEIPGHTLGHVAYYLTTEKALFTGDTLFCAGCGRIFEGTPEQMYASLMKIKSFPDDTKIYCAHEYTLNNLRFAEQVDSTNKDVKQRLSQVQKLHDQHLPTIPSLLSDEKKTNPFLRCDIQTVITSVEQYAKRSLVNPVEVFEYLRKWKDHF